MPGGYVGDGPKEQRQMFGRYQIIGELGRGGMGVVYQAYDPQLKRQVALKIIGQTADQDKARERFMREASVMAQLDHAHIVKVFDVGEEQGYAFFTMELVDGQGLDNLLGQNIALAQLLQLLAQVARAVHYAHERGILHRDIKPSNILVTMDMQPKVMDFGLAKEMGERANKLSKSQDIVGTPQYMSPEQVAGKIRKLDARSDVYSLGVILYEILVGHPPFSARDTMALLYQIGFEEPAPPSHILPRVSRDLEAICLKAIEKNRDRRYQSACELAADIERYLNNEPVLAKPVTPVVRAWKWVARHRLVCGMCAMTLTLVLMFILQLQHRASFETDRRMIEADLRMKAEIRWLDANSRWAHSELNQARLQIDKKAWLEATVRQRQASARLRQDDIVAALQQAHVPVYLGKRYQYLLHAAATMDDYVLPRPRELRPISWQQVADAVGQPYHIAYQFDQLAAVAPSQPCWQYGVAYRRPDNWPLLYDMTSRQVRPLPKDFGTSDHALAFSADARFVAWVDSRHQLWVWEIGSQTPEPVADIALVCGRKQAQGKIDVRCMRISHDNRWLCAATEKDYWLWHLPSRQLIYNTKYDGKPCIAFSRSGRSLACGLFLQVVVLALNADKPAASLHVTFPADPFALAFGPQERTLWIGQYNDILIVPLPSTAASKERSATSDANITLLDAHNGRIWDLALGADERKMASLGKDCRLVAWDARQYRKLLETKVQPTSGMGFLAFHRQSEMVGVWKPSGPEGYNLNTKTDHHLDFANRPEVKVFKLIKGIQNDAIARTRGDSGAALAVSPDRRHIAFALVGRPYLWDTKSDQVWEMPGAPPSTRISLVFHSDSLLLGHDYNYRIVGWKMTTRERVVSHSLTDPHCQTGVPLAGSEPLANPPRQELVMWKIHDDNLLLHGRCGRDSDTTIFAKTFSPDGNMLALGCLGLVEVWQVTGESPRLLATAATDSHVDACLCFDEQGHLAMGNDSGDCWFTDWRAWKGRSQVLKPSLQLADQIKRIWYQKERKLYWIYTKSGLFLYPHLDRQALQEDQVLAQMVAALYPLPAYLGQSPMAIDISMDFSQLFLLLQSGEIVSMPLRTNE